MESDVNPGSSAVLSLYDSEADWYDEDVRRSGYFAPAWVAKHAGELGGLAECRVLDLGCGTGLNVRALCEAREGVIADGVDISPRMIELARGTGGYKQVHVHDIGLGLGIAESVSYDLVIALGIFELLRDARACLAECQRVLKPLGKLWASFRRFEEGDEASPARYVFFNEMALRGYSAAEILHMVKSAGLTMTSMDAVVGHVTRAGFGYPCYVLRACRNS